MGILVPAVLPTSREDLETKLALFEKMPAVTRVQIDAVDNTFASTASWPYNAIEEFQHMVKTEEHLPFIGRFEYEVDLMGIDAERAGDAWLSLGAVRLTFHTKSSADLSRLLTRMRTKYSADVGFLPDLVAFGVALDMQDDLGSLDSSLDKVDYVQFMGIDSSGKQGEPFNPRVLDRIRAFQTQHPDISVQVDGGVSLTHARELLEIGVTNVIVGSAILNTPDPIASAAAFDNLQNPYGI